MRKILGAPLSLLLVVLSACGADPSSSSVTEAPQVASNSITGSVSEWKVELSAARASAGDVRFAIANFGTMRHEFLVVRTTYGPGEIPIGSGNRFDEEGSGVSVVDEISEWPVNEAHVLTVNLPAGTYELLCNLPGHYANGMHRTLVVE